MAGAGRPGTEPETALAVIDGGFEAPATSPCTDAGDEPELIAKMIATTTAPSTRLTLHRTGDEPGEGRWLLRRGEREPVRDLRAAGMSVL